MIYDTLGNTDLKVSKICLGTMTFGEQNSMEEGHEQLDYAVEQGVNFIDTAEMYSVPAREETFGATEAIIGKWLKQRDNRDKLVIASKIVGPGSNFKYIRGGSKYNREQMVEALNGSLSRLQTDYIDLYQLHWPERSTNYFGKRDYQHEQKDAWKDNMLEVLEILQDFVKEGKIRYFGLSNETPWGVSKFLKLAEIHGLPRCMSVQNPYSLLNRTYEVGLAEISIREECGLLAYSPLAMGVLSGKYLGGKQPEGARLVLFPRMRRYSSENATKATQKYQDIALKHGLSLASLSLAFVNNRPFLTSNIIGATTLEQLKENIDSVKISLSDEIMGEIEAVHKELPNPAP